MPFVSLYPLKLLLTGPALNYTFLLEWGNIHDCDAQ